MVISLAIIFSNPLQFYVAVSIIFPEVIAPRINRKWHVLAEYVLRYAIIAFCCETPQTLFETSIEFEQDPIL